MKKFLFKHALDQEMSFYDEKTVGDIKSAMDPMAIAIAMAIPIAINMMLQTMTNLVDVYFVGQLGEHALAGVSASGNINLININTNTNNNKTNIFRLYMFKNQSYCQYKILGFPLLIKCLVSNTYLLLLDALLYKSI